LLIYEGDLYICGLRVKNSTKDELLASIRLNKIAFVFQTFNLIGSLTALENVELPMQLRVRLILKYRGIKAELK
jgi:putative ABC transport system ATP-binding protein